MSKLKNLLIEFCIVFPLIFGVAGRNTGSVEAAVAPAAEYLTESEFRQKEKENLLAALRAADWRVWGPEGAAALLGIKPSTLSYRMSSFGISRTAERG